MAEVLNCPRCHALYRPNAFFSCCLNCGKEEEALYQKTYQFLRKRENRAATTEQVIQEVGVSKKLLYNWVRKGRLRTAVFPNLSYPCDRCGALIKSNRLCSQCNKTITKDLKAHEEEAAHKSRKKPSLYRIVKNK